MKNIITKKIRQEIADEMTFGNISYYGGLSEPNFLNRVFDLKNLPSEDDRFGDAYSDICQHTVLNPNDWPDDWIYTDYRINLLECEDSVYIKFLNETIHPRVRIYKEEIEKLIEIYNRNLKFGGYEVVESDEISGLPIFSIERNSIGNTYLATKKVEIIKYFDTDYVKGKLEVMNNAIDSGDTDLAIGTAKELIETTCKSILKQRGDAFDHNSTLSQLLSTTVKCMTFSPPNIDNPSQADRSIKKILGGISSIVQGVSELRNGYGTGHGKDSNFIGLGKNYAKLLVGVVSDLVIFLIAINGDSAELVEN